MIIRYLAATILAIAFATVIPACVHDAALSSGATVGDVFVSDATVLVHGIT